jgi:hypothetical protein
MMVHASAIPSGAAVASITNERSIFSVSTGSLDRQLSEENVSDNLCWIANKMRK